eukprot:TRINITY_DN307_c0_g1_i1.p2 TRINITY_DN307_c0_g1~~TRINITY_DN307_c0_g1_i1.p2  ORF type:complete len:73 (-),score=3.72 TRINITY_DN307_c0_g1_i1:65-283(-)
MCGIPPNQARQRQNDKYACFVMANYMAWAKRPTNKTDRASTNYAERSPANTRACIAHTSCTATRRPLVQLRR